MSPYTFWIAPYVLAQILHLFVSLVMIYFFTRKVNWVDTSAADEIPEEDLPFIVLIYPVLQEDEGTMHSTLVTLSWLEYPTSRYRVIAVPNADDDHSIQALERLQAEFSFLEIAKVPPTSDPSWQAVWDAWDDNPNAYWYHEGSNERVRDLPPKKTRQLIYIFYSLLEEMGSDWVLDYIDADSMPPPRHFMSAAAGLQTYDVLQATNVAGNLLGSVAASYHAFDHMCWDGLIYPHMSANGRHPFYVLGKGLFYKASDLADVGCFNPWITIEDPEIGMRLWTHGKKLGVIADPLIEEVPPTFKGGIIQRNRWMCGFFQSLWRPLKQMGMSFPDRMRARLNIVPVLALPLNIISVPTGTAAMSIYVLGHNPFPQWVVWLSALNLVLYWIIIVPLHWNAFLRTKLVLDGLGPRLWYMFRVNPFFMFFYYLLWAVPSVVGFWMFLGDRGKTWVRTEKFNADEKFASRNRDDWPTG
jgi:cellulose synthase/poly-beta-1,6-N-acetylglucosamine synthase-like glycosyltransferase